MKMAIMQRQPNKNLNYLNICIPIKIFSTNTRAIYILWKSIIIGGIKSDWKIQYTLICLTNNELRRAQHSSS